MPYDETTEQGESSTTQRKDQILEENTIIGRYQLLQRIGQGGMGEVYLAEQLGPEGFTRKAVIKRLLNDKQLSRKAMVGFADEARLAARLQHPHIVRTEDFFEYDGNYHLVLEYIPGETLQHLSRCAHSIDTTLPPAALVQIAIDIAEALDFAHALVDDDGEPLGIVHRDVSPQNIMVTPDGHAKLLDFGIAASRVNRAITNAQSIRGKVLYFSPEQARGSGIDGRSDQFSLAIILYECLSRTHLFGDSTLLNIIRRVERCEFPELWSVAEAVPRGLSQVIGRALSENPLDRYRDCSEFAGALSQCLKAIAPTWRRREYRAWRTTLFDRVDTTKTPPRYESLSSCLDSSDSSTRLSNAATPPVKLDNTIPPKFESASDPFGEDLPSPIPQHIPEQSNRFIGRMNVMDKINQDLQAGERLLTLVGMGGMGKTRLAKEVAHQAAGSFDGGTWFCELVDARSNDDILAAVTKAMSISLPAHRPMERLIQILNSRGTTCLILDNVEHVRPFVRDFVVQISEKSPTTTFVLTSRSPLETLAERVISIGALGLAEGMELFFDRARSEGVQLNDNDDTHLTVKNIVERVQGHALAIEIAAAQAKHLELAELEVQLSEQLPSRTGDPSELMDKGSSIAATIEWSWNLLSAMDKGILAQLSIHNDGFDMSAAEATVRVEPTTAPVADLESSIARLVKNSLLDVVEGADGIQRYSMLGAIRTFALSKLGTQRPLLERRHWQHYARFGQGDHRATTWSTDGRKLRRLIRDNMPNILTASERAISHGDHESAACCAIAVGLGAEGHLPVVHSIRLLQNAVQFQIDATLKMSLFLLLSRLANKLTNQDQKSAIRADALNWANEIHDEHAQEIIAFHQTRQTRRILPLDVTTRKLHGHLASFRRLNDKHYECITLTVLGSARADPNEGVRDYQEALRIAERLNFGDVLPTARGNLGNIFHRLGLIEDAKALYKHAVIASVNAEHRRDECTYRANLGNAYRSLGQPGKAMNQYRRALKLAEQQGQLFDQARILMSVGNCYRGASRFDKAMKFYDAARRLTQLIGSALVDHICLGEIGELKLKQADYQGACTLFQQTIDGTAKSGPSFAALNCGRLASALAHLGQVAQAQDAVEHAWILLSQHDSSMMRGFILCHEMTVYRLSHQATDFEATRLKFNVLVEHMNLPSASLLMQAYNSACAIDPPPK